MFITVTNFTFINTLVAVSFAAVCCWGILRYFWRQPSSKLMDLENTDSSSASNSSRSQLVFQPLQWIKYFSIDRWVPVSQKIQETSLQLKDRSPWQGLGLSQEDEKNNPANVNSWIKELASRFRLFFKYVWIYWSPYVAIAIISAICMMGMPAYQIIAAQKLGIAIDQGGSVLVSSAIQLAILLPLAFGSYLLGSRLSARLSSRVANDIRHDLFVKLQTLSPSFYKQARPGDLLTHFSVDIYQIEPVLGQEMIRSVGEVIMTLVNVGMMIRISGFLAVASIIPMVVMLPLTLYLINYMTKRGLRAINQNAMMTDAVQEGIRAQPMIAGYGLQSLFTSYFSNELKKLEDKKTEAVFSFLLFTYSVTFSAYLLDVWVMGVGGVYVLSHKITLGAWITFFSISHNMYNLLGQLVNTRIGRWFGASIGMQRIDKVLTYPTKIVDAVDAHALTTFEKKIGFENLSFSYDNAQHQLHEIDLSIEAGQFVAFVGSSGAGKSTIFNLLMRFYDPSDGRITIDGHDLRHLTQKSLRSKMGVVLQETFLFHTTIMNNIRIAKPEATEEEVFAAAQAAEIHDFILSLPDGYQTMVGEAGGRLSGGQRQRIAIAQALLCSAPILLLDEPTSSLSAEMADAINQTIASLAGKHTVIMITHQLKAAIQADYIFVLDQGRLVEQGTHEQLLTIDGHYRYLWNIQQA
ncbi:ABC transporter ATP-binding protein/permease [Planktothrix agardhii 1806]|jgi:ATP-binding cassette subfamily B protein|uniref:ABC transporter ATP-binding protein n=1 Tax=Planktothrix agardhii TaxID=1160 RepID=UPI001D09ED3B|nr:ABC transporter ATP-binding protein [Planktothrix agardhii]MCB8753348.1 ABC transporter ATP-binding protein/permease [Planktothrix agardhii 1810]MCB8761907.1 ABC transporter ATP-binding protein/permease [Planktothrix agardhii 1813]MCF3569025.1 ABC transporter ATP-binding protein/permease [Planktothrix agardhii 1807]MCF3573669.1 ABC transporter ATP-binding protein/permease [Planktothrix agardhii 1805]MCF3573698.1 ABC transporter ATP-binding protein/permease [Planktothrix agardhii 1805]